MADLDKVLKGLLIHGDYGGSCSPCPYDCEDRECCVEMLCNEAAELLKSQKIVIDQFMQEQMAKEPVIFGDGATFEEAKNFWYACAVCKNPLDFCDNFCRKCGSAIDWKGVKKDGDDDGN